MSIIIKSGNSTDLAGVDSSGNLRVNTPGYDSAGVSRGGGPENAGAIAIYSENDAGTATGQRVVYSPETDGDYRLRMALDNMLDAETFMYTAQNTAKHTYLNSTLTATWSAAGLRTNAVANTAAGGVTIGTYAEFPVFGANNLFAEFAASFDNQPTTNVLIDFGLFRRGAATQYAPTDGVYFRLTSAGFQGVINYNGTETTTSVFPFTYSINQKYQFIITVNQRSVHFWIDEVLQGELNTPVGQSQPCLSATLPLSIRHGQPSTAGGAFSMFLNSYNVTIGGAILNRTLGEIGNSMLGSYQSLSGGTTPTTANMGALIGGTITTGTLVQPTPAVPTNTTSALLTALGGRSWETFTSGLGTAADGILMAYQVPAGTIAVQGKRLKLIGIKMSGWVQTVLVGGPIVSEFMLGFGSTAVSLQTAEAASTKTPRRVMLPELTQFLTANQAVSTAVSQPFGSETSFQEPIYVNPGEFIQLIVRHTGTAISSGVVARSIQPIFSWE